MEAVLMKRFFVMLVICLTLLVGTLYFRFSKDLSQLIHIKKARETKNIHMISYPKKDLQIPAHKRIFQILYWTGSSKGSHSPRNWFGLGSKPFDKCEYRNCNLTGDRSDYNNSDGILIYMRYAKPLPTYRFPWQKWIMRIHESPANERDYTEYNGVFNATWTYHTKSDIYSHIYYRQFVSKADGDITASHPVDVSHKDRTVAWFVGRCPVQSQRKRLVARLKNYLDVDIYGKCGHLTCGAKMNKDCDRMLSTKYKFYLSFENSLCEQYVTEKLWRAYSNNVVPIVMGASNYSPYSAYLPEHSYIDIRSFSSVKELAEYIKVLDKNETLYMEYFAWKNKYEITGFKGGDACPLCKFMNTQSNVTKVYNTLNLFWNTKNDCFQPEVYYQKLFAQS